MRCHSDSTPSLASWSGGHDGRLGKYMVAIFNRQIVNVCEKYPECTLFGKNIKTSATYNSAKPLPALSAPNQELELDFAGPLIDDRKTIYCD